MIRYYALRAAVGLNAIRDRALLARADHRRRVVDHAITLKAPRHPRGRAKLESG